MASILNRLKPLVGAAIVIVAALVGIGLLQRPKLQEFSDRAAKSVPEINRQTDAEHAKLLLLRRSPAFGYDNLMADWAFLGFLQYFGDEDSRVRTDYALSPEYFEIIVDRDPYFLQAYPFLSTSISLYAGMPDRSIALMNRGLSRLTPEAQFDSFYVWRQKAIDELLFLGDTEAARKSFLTAADWAVQSGLPDSDAVVVQSRQTADFLAQNPDSTYAQINAWVMILTTTPDERARKTAIEKIQQLGGAIVSNPDGTFSVQRPSED